MLVSSGHVPFQNCPVSWEVLRNLGHSSSALEGGDSLFHTPKWATTEGALESAGSISVMSSTRMNRLVTLCLLPKVERTRSMASSSSDATRSTENGWSLFPALYDPRALNAFMARPR